MPFMARKLRVEYPGDHPLGIVVEQRLLEHALAGARLAEHPRHRPPCWAWTRVSGLFAISFEGEVGRSCRLEARDNLTSGSW